jgi:hypothetical protein
MEQELHSKILTELAVLKTISEATLKQAEKTNGRVTILEDKVDSLELTRAENKGSWKATGSLASAVSVAVYFILGKVLK